MQKTINQLIVETGVETGNHASDLYCKVTPETTKIVNEYEFKKNVEIFINNITHELWYDIPFSYDAFWAKIK